MEQDFYSGFEGEPEIVVWSTLNGAVQRRLRIWEGFFDALMNEVAPAPNGWAGLWSEYHAGDDFSEPWPDTAPQETATCLRGLSLRREERTSDVCRAWIDLLEDAVHRGAEVYVLKT